MRHIVSSSALLIVIVFLCVETCTTNASHDNISYDDGIHLSMFFLSLC